MEDKIIYSGVQKEAVSKEVLVAKARARQQFEVKREELFHSMSILFEDNKKAFEILEKKLSEIYDEKGLQHLYSLFVNTYNRFNMNNKMKNKKLKLMTLNTEIDTFLDDSTSIRRFSNAGAGFF